MPVYSLIIINKAGGLVYQREFQPGLRKLSTNDYLVLAGTFHGVHAITRSITPKIPNQNAVSVTSSTTQTPTPTTTAAAAAAASPSSTSVLSPSSTSIPTPTPTPTPLSTTSTTTPALPPSTSTPSNATYTYPIPNLPLSGLETLESDKFTLTCFQTLTGTKFLLFTDPQMANIEGIMKTVYELYADYVMKNPFYQLEMPVRCEAFERGVGGFLRARG
ncbi:Longin-like domain-containing protein [Aspergillus cavernicola]|uniref:Trafficking protein particle complex subunit n=1 Tax=Aspergillus cavernicola TaxID=176166 RepID=A0ABR4HPM9_9EURO